MTNPLAERHKCCASKVCVCWRDYIDPVCPIPGWSPARCCICGKFIERKSEYGRRYLGAIRLYEPR